MIYPQSLKKMLILSMAVTLFILVVTSCNAKNDAADSPEIVSTSVALAAAPGDDAAQVMNLPTATPAPQLLSTPASFGPDLENFPTGYNPLNAQEMEDPSLLETPALLVSISHFPPATTRPQAGLSFAPWVFEFYITEGATRFLSVFYGDYPKPEIPVIGDCKIRQDIFIQTAHILGNRVWLDENKNGRQESYEPGVGGICVKLYDSSGQVIQQTTTDSNGYYGFNVKAGKYSVEFDLPERLNFTSQNVGDENADSDADQSSGRAEADVQASLLYLDSGLIPSETAKPNPNDSVEMPIAEVGPIRSGRMLYADIGGFFRNSCLIYAFASPEVLELIPQCVFVPHDVASGGAMMSLERMKKIAEDNKRLTRNDFNYSGNLFTEEAPSGGAPANQINVYVALLNQSGWAYDPLSGSWQRFVDNAKVENAGQLHPEIDRLTGRQLQFENIVVVIADHEVITPTNLDIHLDLGNGGYAYLFRDGKKYDIRWSLQAREYEKKTGRTRPLHFVNPDGSSAALKPGNIWIFVATPYSILSDKGDGAWLLRYYPPQGSK